MKQQTEEEEGKTKAAAAAIKRTAANFIYSF